MTKIKILGAVAIVAALAAPVFAQDEGVLGPGSRNGLTPQPGVTHHVRSHHHWMRYRSSMASMDRTSRSRPGGQSVARKPSGS